MAEWDLIVAPVDVRVEFRVSAPLILSNSLHLISYYEDTDSGLHSWINETYRSLTPEQKQTLKIFIGCLGDTLMNTEDISFPEFVDYIEQMDAVKVRDTAIEWMKEYPDFPGFDAILASEEAMIGYLKVLYANHKHGKEFEEAHWHRIYPLFSNPVELKQFVVKEMRSLWDEYLAKEWKRSQSLVYESAAAYSRKDFSGLNAFDAIEAVTGRDMHGNEKLEETLPKVRRLIFMPSPHLGPYISWQPMANPADCVVLFGARMPKGVEAGSRALNRSELLVWLNALADDTRLKMLEMLLEHEELCAQDFIDMLELSQSSASRHLRQLAASGFLQVRRRDVNKCYTLNRDRIEETLKALNRIVQK